MTKTFNHSEYNLKRYHRLRAEYIDLLGGKCAQCATSEKLQIDHIDPSTKTLDIPKMMTYSKSLVLEELKKCQLLCKSCHICKTKNNKDGYEKRAKGEKIIHSKLNAQLVLEIRQKMEHEKSDLLLARMYGVTKASMYQIRNRRTWKHV